MAEFKFSDELENKYPVDDMDKSEVISEIIEQVIKEVENQKSDASYVLKCEDAERTELYKCKDNTSSYSKFEDSSADRSKSHRSGSRKIRVRNKKRKWKPYCKLNWEERKKLEERDTRRAFRFREKMSASGLTLAPYNTTQFLMEDHNLQEPDYESIHHDTKNKDDSHSYDSEEFYSSPEDEEEFLHQQFSETYKSLHDAYIDNMPKLDLIRECMRLEDEVENVEQSLRECREQKQFFEHPRMDVEAELEKIKVFQDEIEKLTRENLLLEKENLSLKNRLSRLRSG